MPLPHTVLWQGFTGPQSVAQVALVSPAPHTPLPQAPVHCAPQSAGKVVHSPSSQKRLPSAGEQLLPLSSLQTLLQPSEPAQAEIPIEGYVYAQGDLLAGDAIPTVAPGGTITFDNIDAPLNNGVWHPITACKAPCDATTGVAYPLADADIPFDSGQLGAVGPPTAGRVT